MEQEEYPDYNDGNYDQYDNDYDNNHDYYDEYADDYYMEIEPNIQYTDKKEYEVLQYNAIFPEVIKHLKTAN